MGGSCTSNGSAKIGRPGVIALKHEAVGKKNGSCVEYEIADMMELPPPNTQTPPILVVEANGVKACK